MINHHDVEAIFKTHGAKYVTVVKVDGFLNGVARYGIFREYPQFFSIPELNMSRGYVNNVAANCYFKYLKNKSDDQH